MTLRESSLLSLPHELSLQYYVAKFVFMELVTGLTFLRKQREEIIKIQLFVNLLSLILVKVNM
jgi:hypothetical protein